MHLSGRPLAKPYRTRAFFLRIFLPACKKLVVLGHFSFQFELRFFLIWSWSIPVGASKIRCSTRAFAVSKAAVTDHSRHGNAKCEQDSKSGSRASGSWVRIPPYPPKESSKLNGLLDFPFSRILKFPNSCVRTAYFLVENRVQIRFCYLALLGYIFPAAPEIIRPRKKYSLLHCLHRGYFGSVVEMA